MLIGYKYAGKVHNIMDESQVYTYSEEPHPGIRPITYISNAGGSLDVRDDGACYDMGGANVSSTINRVAGSYTLEDGMFVIRETTLMYEQQIDEENEEYKVVAHEQVISVNKFEIRDNQLVHKEYINYQDNINTIENGDTMTLVLEQGNLRVAGYSIGEYKLEEGVQLPEFVYCY